MIRRRMCTLPPRQCPLSVVGDPQRWNFITAVPNDDRLRRSSSEPGAYQIHKLVDRETAGKQHGFAATFDTGIPENFQRAAGGIGIVPASSERGIGHGGQYGPNPIGLSCAGCIVWTNAKLRSPRHVKTRTRTACI
jgi:hypothetical protein